MISVLYSGAADLARPTAGLDLASRCHFEEIAGDARLAVTAISVSPLPVDPAIQPRRPARLFASDMLTLHGARQRWAKKLALLARGGILFHSGLISAAAGNALRACLADEPDVVLIDNVAGAGNISLLRLLRVRLRGRSKIMVIAHDASAEVLRDRAALQPSRVRALAIRLHALHCHLYESTVFALAHRVVFLSQTDRDRFRFLPAAKTDILCLLLDGPAREPDPAAVEPGRGRYLMFIGSPSFFANAFAIDWITTQFAPRLHALVPDMTILLVGKGTDGPDIARPGNVVGLGFVAESDMHGLLRNSCGMLSPVIHGSGIKIKVIEAIASGTVVFATRSSLRGYEFMRLDPLLYIDDADASVARVCAIAGDPARLAAYKRQIAKSWATYQQERSGKLAEAVYRLATVG